MRCAHILAGVLGVTMPLVFVAGSPASEASEHPGRISGTVVSAATGEPVAGAYVGIGDFGDAGGANLGRFRKEGRFAETETDAQGHFFLQGARVPDEHPLVVTHPEFVRHDQTVALRNKEPVEVKVSLTPGAKIEATAVDGDGNPLEGRVLIRLEALDGHLFIPPGQDPHQSTFASSIWMARSMRGTFSFTELEAGRYGLDVIRLGDAQASYHGGLPEVEATSGETGQVRIPPVDHQTSVTINIARTLQDTGVPSFVVVGRNPGLLLWYDGLTHSLEDPRLGRIVQTALFFLPLQQGNVFTVENLPPGTYSVFAGAPMCLGAARLDLARGEQRTLDIPRVEPEGVGMVNLASLRRRVELEARAYTAQELCQLLTTWTDGSVRFEADPSIRDEAPKLPSGRMRMWDVLEKLYLAEGWRVEEKGRDGLVLLPESMAAKPKTVSPAEAARIGPPQISYEETFLDLYETLGREYPCFDLKGIDWGAVGEELLPRAKQAEMDEQFGRLCLELVARLEDSHASVMKGTREPPWPPFPRWDPGLACLIDDRGKPAVYYVDKGGPADRAGVKIGMTVLSVNGKPATEAIEQCMEQTSKYSGYSSERYLRYQAARWFVRQREQGAKLTLEAASPDGQTHTFNVACDLSVRYLPRLPVPIPGIPDTANVSWTMLDDVGYIYVRRIRGDLIERLDQAVGELKKAKGLIVDVRGNSGGGFDAARSHRNFDPHDHQEPERPRFSGPVALLIDARCISAGEGWASWFIANDRARVFGEATAGASSRKRTYTLKNGFYSVRFPVKAYHGFLDRPIERRGLEPDVALRQTAQDLAAGRDTVLEAAKRYLLEAKGCE